MPDKLDAHLEAIAAQFEWSYSETIRRAAELLIGQYPHAGAPKQEWKFPVGRPLGVRDDIDWSKAKDELYDRNPFKSIEDQ